LIGYASFHRGRHYRPRRRKRPLTDQPRFRKAEAGR
jgi:hypothetical protein